MDTASRMRYHNLLAASMALDALMGSPKDFPMGDKPVSFSSGRTPLPPKVREAKRKKRQIAKASKKYNRKHA